MVQQAEPAEQTEPAEQAERAEPADAGHKQLTDMVAELARDFDSVLPHLVAALDRDKAFDEISERLRRAEASAAVGMNWVLINGIHKLLSDTRRLDLDPRFRSAFVRDLSGLLRSVGVTEFGRRGEEFDADRHEAVQAVGDGQRFLVATVHASGLERAGAVLKRAKVTVERSSRRGERPMLGAEDNGEQ